MGLQLDPHPQPPGVEASAAVIVLETVTNDNSQPQQLPITGNQQHPKKGPKVTNVQRLIQKIFSSESKGPPSKPPIKPNVTTTRPPPNYQAEPGSNPYPNPNYTNHNPNYPPQTNHTPKTQQDSTNPNHQRATAHNM